MFGPKHYVPILRSKDGEMYALEHLEPKDRERITPLIEITPRVFEPPRDGKSKGVAPEAAEVLIQQARKLLRSWKYTPFFLDLWHIDQRIPPINGQTHPFIYIAKTMRDYRLKAVPVTGIDRAETYQDAVREINRIDSRGGCLRLQPNEILRPSFEHLIASTLARLNLRPEDADLLIDYGIFDAQNTPFGPLATKIPHLGKWRSLILASGSFPKDLQNFQPGSHIIPREDYLNWLATQHSVSRKPSFADYTIQYGRYVEPADNCNPSASIRYALENSWLIMRGEAIRQKKGKVKGPGTAQWIANAILLRDREDFYGPNFSDGDAYIFTMSQRTSKPHGSPMTWIRAGLNHHMTVVSRQIGCLNAP